MSSLLSTLSIFAVFVVFLGVTAKRSLLVFRSPKTVDWIPKQYHWRVSAVFVLWLAFGVGVVFYKYGAVWAVLQAVFLASLFGLCSIPTQFRTDAQISFKKWFAGGTMALSGMLMLVFSFYSVALLAGIASQILA